MDEREALLTLKLRITQHKIPEFTTWQAKFHDQIYAFAGFVSLEIISPKKNSSEWLIVQRFQNNERMLVWRMSEEYKERIAELSKFVEAIQETEVDLNVLNEGVTEVIVTQVVPEKEQEFRRWIAKIHQVESTFPGFRSVYVQSPTASQGKYWITLLQFDSLENLDRWLNSSEREKIIEESKSMVSYVERHRVVSPYAGWFPSMAQAGNVPAVWKQSMVVLLTLFPIVMLELKFLNPHLESLNPSLATFIGNSISVSLLAWPFMLIAVFYLNWWLSSRDLKKTLIGTMIVLLLYLLEILIFW